MSIQNPNVAEKVIMPIDDTAAQPSIAVGNQDSGTGIRGEYFEMNHSVSGADVMTVDASGVTVVGTITADEIALPADLEVNNLQVNEDAAIDGDISVANIVATGNIGAVDIAASGNIDGVDIDASGNMSCDALVASVSVKAASFISSDNTAGATADVLVDGVTLSFKNGLFVGSA